MVTYMHCVHHMCKPKNSACMHTHTYENENVKPIIVSQYKQNLMLMNTNEAKSDYKITIPERTNTNNCNT